MNFLFTQLYKHQILIMWRYFAYTKRKQEIIVELKNWNF